MRRPQLDREWHDARLAEGPSGYIRERGADTWDKLHAMCAEFMRDWEGRAPDEREVLAYPNPEDRRRV